MEKKTEDSKSSQEDLFFNALKDNFNPSTEEHVNKTVLNNPALAQDEKPMKTRLLQSPYQGYMHKMRGNRETKKRYCNFLEGVLYFFKDKDMIAKGFLEHELNVTNWYLWVHVPSENSKIFKYEIMITRKEKALVLFTDNETLFQKMIEGLEKYCIRINMQNEYECQGSAYSVNKKEFVFMKNINTKYRVIGKFLKKASLKTLDQINQFLNELSILRRLNNKCILNFCGLYEEEHYFIMLFEKFLENRDYVSLNLFLKTKTCIEEIAGLKLAEDLIEGLEYLHTKEFLMHNFVKEENTLISVVDGFLNAKIFNFCYSKRFSQYHTYTSDFELSTYSGYVSPELLKLKDNEAPTVTPQLDIFALGCVLVRAFTGLTALDLAKNNYTILNESVKHLSKNTVELLVGLTNKDPQKRLTLLEAKKLAQDTSHQLLGLKVPEFQLINNRLKANIRTLSSISLHSGFANNYIMPPVTGLISQHFGSSYLEDKNTNNNEIQALFWGSVVIPSVIQEDETNGEKSDNGVNKLFSQILAHDQDSSHPIKLKNPQEKDKKYHKLSEQTRTMESIPDFSYSETPLFQMENLKKYQISKKFIPLRHQSFSKNTQNINNNMKSQGKRLEFCKKKKEYIWKDII